MPDEVKGMGSAFGGEWKPKKPEDERFLGEPGEIKITVKKNGTVFLTKIGEDGKANSERHCTDHGYPNKHSNPHDHPIDWTKGFPFPKKPINYPSGAPKFKYYKENQNMNKKIESFDELAFESIGDFKWHIAHGCEIEFIWHGKSYSITHPNGLICIGEGYYYKDGNAFNLLSNEPYDPNEILASANPDDILDFFIDGQKLRDIVTQIGIVDRTT